MLVRIPMSWPPIWAPTSKSWPGLWTLILCIRGRRLTKSSPENPYRQEVHSAEREATGRGVAYLVGRVLESLGIRTDGATAIVQGFGNVGSIAAYALTERGLKIIGVSDDTAAYYDPGGLEISALHSHTSEHDHLAGFSSQSLIEPSEMLVQKCDVLTPAALEQVITGRNAAQLKCRVLAEGANGPTTPEADAILHPRGDEIFLLPDILCNAGGVIEWVQDLQRLFWEQAEVFDVSSGYLNGRSSTLLYARDAMGLHIERQPRPSV